MDAPYPSLLDALVAINAKMAESSAQVETLKGQYADVVATGIEAARRIGQAASQAAANIPPPPSSIVDPYGNPARPGAAGASAPTTETVTGPGGLLYTVTVGPNGQLGNFTLVPGQNQQLYGPNGAPLPPAAPTQYPFALSGGGGVPPAPPGGGASAPATPPAAGGGTAASVPGTGGTTATYGPDGLLPAAAGGGAPITGDTLVSSINTATAIALSISTLNAHCSRQEQVFPDPSVTGSTVEAGPWVVVTTWTCSSRVVPPSGAQFQSIAQVAGTGTGHPAFGSTGRSTSTPGSGGTGVTQNSTVAFGGANPQTLGAPPPSGPSTVSNASTFDPATHVSAGDNAVVKAVADSGRDTAAAISKSIAAGLAGIARQMASGGDAALQSRRYGGLAG